MEKKNSSIYEEWRKGESYANKKELYAMFDLCKRFYEGDQWPPITRETADIPRPVDNYCKVIADTQVSNLLGAPYKLNFVCHNSPYNSEKLTKFVEYLHKEMKLDEISEECLYDDAIKGTFAFYEYWDENAQGKNGEYKGALRCEALDPSDIAVANPSEKDYEKQEWIIYRSRISVGACKQIADEGVNKELIQSDALENKYEGNIEQDDDANIYLYTKFYKVNGEVCFERATKSAIINHRRFIDPSLNVEGGEEDEEKAPLQDEELSSQRTRARAPFYPIIIASLSPSNDSIFGLSTIKSIIPNQKYTNLLNAMLLYAVQQCAWPKYLVKPNALRGQLITNKVGETLVDYSQGAGWGVTAMQGQQMNNGALELVENRIKHTRIVSNADETMTGDVYNQSMTATAVNQITAQKKKNIDRKQKRFWRVLERIGMLTRQMAQLYYDEENFEFEINDEMLQRLREYASENGQDPSTVSKNIGDVFRGKEMAEKSFDITCESGAGTQYSEIAVMQLIDNLVTSGGIQTLTPDTIDLLCVLMPENYLTSDSKSKLKAYAENIRTGQLTQLQGQVQQLTQEKEQIGQVVEQQANYIESLKKAYDEEISKLTDDNNGLKEFLGQIKLVDGPNDKNVN